MTVAELVACLPELRGQLPLRRRVDRAAMLVEEHVEQPVDRLRTVPGGEMVAASQRRALVDFAIDPFASGRLRREAALESVAVVLVIPTGSPLLAALDG